MNYIVDGADIQTLEKHKKTALAPPEGPRRAPTRRATRTKQNGTWGLPRCPAVQQPHQKPTALGSPEGPRRATVRTGQDRSTILWNMVVPFDSTTWRRKLDVNVTLHDVVKRSVVDSAGFFAKDTSLEKTLSQRKVGADSDVVSV